MLLFLPSFKADENVIAVAAAAAVDSNEDVVTLAAVVDTNEDVVTVAANVVAAVAMFL